MRMHQVVASVVTLAFIAGIAFAGGDTALTYQGRLLDAGEPANGPHDFEFSLWDGEGAGSNQIGATVVLNNTPVTDGLFSVQIDFGADAFNNDDRWLEIVVDGTTLSPRQPITRAPYSIQTRGIYVDANQNVGIGTTEVSPETLVHIRHFMGDNFGLLVDAHGVPGTEIGLHTGPAGYASLAKNAFFAPGWTRFDDKAGAYLQEIDPNGNVFFQVTGPGAGFIPWETPLTLDASGMVGIGTTAPTSPLEVASDGPRTIRAFNTGTASTVGVWSEVDSSLGTGVYGNVTASSGTNYGVYGRTESPNGYGVYSDGDFGGNGAKYFIQPHPYDPSKEIRFVCLEGNESGTYFRGSTRLVHGLAVIDVPEEFRLVTEADGLTVQVTAKGPNAGLWVETETLDRIVVRGNGSVKFNYFVNGVRRGFADLELIRDNHAYVPEVRGVPYGTQYREAHRQILVENGILNPDFTPNEATAAMMGWTLRDPTPDELLRAATNRTGETK